MFTSTRRPHNWRGRTALPVNNGHPPFLQWAGDLGSRDDPDPLLQILIGIRFAGLLDVVREAELVDAVMVVTRAPDRPVSRPPRTDPSRNSSRLPPASWPSRPVVAE